MRADMERVVKYQGSRRRIALIRHALRDTFSRTREKGSLFTT